MTADHLTKPERTCTRAQSRAIKNHVLDAGGCCYCLNRTRLFESVGRVAACGLDPPKAFQACVAFGHFEFDEAAYLEDHHG